MSIWRPLRAPVFRNLLIADTVSDIGTFMQNVGAAWLMVSLGTGPLLIALTQTAASLPFFLFALLAGSVGDIVDRRKLVLFTEIWMTSAALVITVLTLTGHMTPWMLLVLTFALSAGNAFEAPTWRALLPELVGREDLPAASALNGIEFNFARAVGPAIAGFIIAAAGVGTAFAVNTVSFMGVIYVIARWNRAVKLRSSPREHLVGATVAALRFVRFSPAVQAVIVRQCALMLFASSLLALLPTVAHSVSNSAMFYGILLGSFGGGAVVGALGLAPVRSRWSMEVVTAVAVAIIGLGLVAISRTHAVALLIVVLIFTGAAWITVMSMVSALIQALAPDWVRARVLAVFLLVFQGSVALGSAVWGVVSQRFGVETALLVAGIGTIGSVGLGVVLRFPAGNVDLAPWQHWATPEVIVRQQPRLDEGPVLVIVEY